MEIMTAQTAGFCFGVKRAIDTVYEQIETGKKIYTYGPIIHNESVVNDLASKGVEVIETEEELRQLASGTVIIRSHGVSKSVYDILEQQHLEIVDATCPFVKRIHNVVQEESDKGRTVIIIGNAGHPEVEGIKGWANNDCYIVENEQQAREITFSEGAKLSIVSQTTFNYRKFEDLVEIFSEKGYDISVVNTICNATEVRQTEAKKIAAQVDAMIVIGGTHSSNTRKLYEICSQECEHTFFIQTLDDLSFKLPKTVKLVGFTAGASTPNNIIEEVQNYVRLNF